MTNVLLVVAFIAVLVGTVLYLLDRAVSRERCHSRCTLPDPRFPEDTLPFTCERRAGHKGKCQSRGRFHNVEWYGERRNMPPPDHNEWLRVMQHSRRTTRHLIEQRRVR